MPQQTPTTGQGSTSGGVEFAESSTETTPVAVQRRLEQTDRSAVATDDEQGVESSTLFNEPGDEHDPSPRLTWELSGEGASVRVENPKAEAIHGTLMVDLTTEYGDLEVYSLGGFQLGAGEATVLSVGPRAELPNAGEVAASLSTRWTPRAEFFRDDGGLGGRAELTHGQVLIVGPGGVQPSADSHLQTAHIKGDDAGYRATLAELGIENLDDAHVLGVTVGGGVESPNFEDPDGGVVQPRFFEGANR